ncbi:hypothetical protein NPIL_605351 [Nephila pilipes]|uniref:Uncharacterized protein n=1 Tax=Nephila pilipes TaxID=299642 RepID=A0A8X6PA76_NEPPI|nr:hypothetical protein NPIL_605351 [Nephila pilipes]
MHEEDTVTLKTLYAWLQNLSDGRESIVDEDHIVRLTTSTTGTSIDWTCHHRIPPLFSKLKVALRGRRFTNIKHIQAAVTRKLRAEQMEELSRAFEDLYTYSQWYIYRTPLTT